MRPSTKQRRILRFLFLTGFFSIILFLAAACEMPRENPYDPGSDVNKDDETAPELISVDPADGAEDVDRYTTVVLSFSEPMAPLTVAERFTMTGTAGDEISGISTWSGAEMVFTPDSPLPYYINCEITLTAGAADPAGNTLDLPFRSDFQVAGLAGEADTDFAEEGILVQEGSVTGAGADIGYAVTPDDEGRIILTGYVDGENGYDLIIMRCFEGGTVDTTFGDFGQVIYDAGYTSNSNDMGYAVAVDSEGRIVVAGARRNENDDSDMALWRYNENGTPDANFGTDGLAIYDYGSGSFDFGRGMVIDGSGNIVVCGSIRPGGTNDMALWRYSSDGTPDTSFGTGGVVSWDGSASGSDYGSDLLIDGSDRILVCGYSSNGTDYDMAVWRFTSDGTPDTDFSGDGVMTHWNAAGGGDNDLASGIALDSTGRILVCGYSMDPTDEYKMVIWSLTDAGAIDSSFGGNGVVVYTGSSLETRGNDIETDAGGGVIVGGHYGGSSSALWRYDSSGYLDSTFGTDGIVVYSGDGETVMDDIIADICLDGQGRPLAAGYLRRDAYDYDIFLRRYR